MIPPGLPVIIRPRKRCERCGLTYLKKRESCPHCSHLADGPELEALKEKQAARLTAGSQLGMIFLVVTIAALVLLLIVAL